MEAMRDKVLLTGGPVEGEVRALEGDLAAEVRLGAGEDAELRRVPPSGRSSDLEFWKKADTDL
jgi:hypothetical protein